MKQVALQALCLLLIAATALSAADEKPAFLPCAVVNGLLGLPATMPCSFLRGARFFRDHYKRGLQMLMKNHRKSLARNRVINALASPVKVTDKLKKIAVGAF
ncbi:hypothetical protein HDE_02596 [Halotydeus destructor]|nr:hypothetical protein HDE_12259 [Halotydeus destructor]KAI1302312.1 hypothetical protein HDE_02596 [Halotydeus destructor]